MANIDPKLLAAIREKTGLSRAQTYARIKQAAAAEYLPRHLAAIKIGAEAGLAINKYASPPELAELRQAGTPVSPPPIGDPLPTPPRRTKTTAKPRKIAAKAQANQVFVVHGRDRAAKQATFDFLRAINVKPIEWNAALKMSKKAAPHLAEVLDAAFAQARAIVVLLTPDDLAQLRPDLLAPTDKPYERTPTGQPRPNVLFEAGMAFVTHPGRTILLQLGSIREFSDVAGRHVIHMTNEFVRRQEFVTKLQNAGCDVDTSGTDWVSAGDFTDPLARTPNTKRGRRRRVTQ